MGTKKTKMFAGILVLIVAVLTLTGVVFQMGIRYYLGIRIQEEMTWQIAQYEKRLMNDASESLLYPEYPTSSGNETSLDVYAMLSKDREQLIPITMLAIRMEDVEEYTDIYSGIMAYCLRYPEMAKESDYRTIKLDGTTYYLMVRNYIYEYPLGYAKEYDQEYEYLVIFMATSDFLYDFVGKIQLVFVLVMLVLGIVLFIGSYNLGMIFEKDKQKLTHYFQNASHELKTPIMSIQGYAEGIQTGVLQDHEKVADVIMEESDRMSSLVEEILILSKMDSGYGDHTREVINLSDLLCDCLERISEQAEQKNIKIQLHLPEENLQISGNELQLERAFGNILSNALRYAKSTIEVEIGMEKKWFRINISNDGDEIAEKDLPHIFDRFYKGEGGQHGIGLAITKEIILLHKGKIQAYNRDGVHFCVWLKRMNLR